MDKQTIDTLRALELKLHDEGDSVNSFALVQAIMVLEGKASPAHTESAAPVEPPEPIATLHDDGYYTWKKGKEPHGARQAGFRMEVFAAHWTPEQIAAVRADGERLAAKVVRRAPAPSPVSGADELAELCDEMFSNASNGNLSSGTRAFANAVALRLNKISERAALAPTPTVTVNAEHVPDELVGNPHAGGTTAYLATEHYNEGWNDCRGMMLETLNARAILATAAPATADAPQRHSWTLEGMKRDPQGVWVLASHGVTTGAPEETFEDFAIRHSFAYRDKNGFWMYPSFDGATLRAGWNAMQRSKP